MIRVKYKKYYNDFRNSQEVKSFYTLDEVADWLFEMVPGAYSKSSLFFINPDKDEKSLLWDGKLHLDNSCIQSNDGHYHYFVEQIEEDNTIIYSCGTFTNGICHWNEKIKQWLRDCRKRKSNPQFNFG